MLPPFELLRPRTLDEAVALLYEKGMSCKILAGGTDLLVRMHESFDGPAFVLDIKGLEALRAFGETSAGGFIAGALSTHFTLSRDAVLKKRYTALAEAAESVGSLQIRHRATVGGNICNAAPSGDTLGPLLALDAVFIACGPGGPRQIPAAGFFAGPGRTVLLEGELLKEVLLPPPKDGMGSAYIKFARRKAMDLALLGASAALTLDAAGCFSHVRVSLTTAGPTPMRAPKTEAFLKGRAAEEPVIAEAGRIASREARPRGSWRSSEEYRRDILETIVPAAIRKAILRAQGPEADRRQE
jgi:CO/xanthine dehydrogenase FAD-binding subunit